MAPPPPPRPNPVHALVARRTGMALSDLQCRRLDEKLAARPGGSSAQYLLHLQGPQGAAELTELIDAIAVQKTELFRDEPQLAALRTHVLEPLAVRGRRPLRVWSAGCATGEEVATLLTLLADVGAPASSTVLGTDISESALVRARELSFSTEAMQRVPAVLRERWFVPVVGTGRSCLAPHLRERASFLCHNLMDHPYPWAGGDGQGFDLIVCRNVLIYFTPESFQRVVMALAERLAPEGLLVLSAAEPLLVTPPGLRTLRYDQAFFYARALEPTGGVERPKASSGRFAAVELPKASSGRFAAVEPPKAGSGRFPAVGAPLTPPRMEGGGEGPPRNTAAYVEAEALFSQVLESATSGADPQPAMLDSLRHCLVLEPELAAARYLLGMLLEQRGALAEASLEYRRTLRSLEEGRARATAFYLNNARLQVACARAIERVERTGPPPAR